MFVTDAGERANKGFAGVLMRGGAPGHCQTSLDGGSLLRESFAAGVQHDPTAQPKQLSSTYLHDILGSHLFETICPEFHLTRAEHEILAHDITKKSARTLLSAYLS